MSGQASVRSDISAITLADRCEVTTSDVHGLSTGNMIRITGLNGMMPVDRGFPQINNSRYQVQVKSTTTFQLRDPITKEYIDSTGYTPYVEGGNVTLFQTNFIYEA